MSRPSANPAAPAVPRAFTAHDHRRCVQQALSAARATCRERGARLTGLREEVLRLVWQSHRPVGAYALLDMLGASNQARRRPGPPTVYRALEFLREQGFVHRVASLNAYVGCQVGTESHDHHLYICRGCAMALEHWGPEIASAVRARGEEFGFAVESVALEVIGLCPVCAEKSG